MTKVYIASAFLATAFLLLSVPQACADPEDGAGCHVFVNVDPNLAIMAMAPNVDLGSVQTGLIVGTIPFRIDANTERVRIWTAASRLFKGDVYDPAQVEIPPIPFEYQSQVGIYPVAASPIGGEDNLVQFVGLHEIDGYPGYVTQRIVFESAQDGHFSQRVDMVVHWNQADPEKPMGEYSGRVKMLAEVVLPE
jgi:hypothetical protein